MSCFVDTECFSWVHAMCLGIAAFLLFVVWWCLFDKVEPPEMNKIRMMSALARGQLLTTWDETRALEIYRAFEARSRPHFSR
jgi:type II secretory pathway component PulM